MVKGLYNIEEVIKADLDYFMSFPYVLKVDVVKVVINKINSEPKTYRYRGSIFTGGKDAVKYDKAWNANKLHIYFNISKQTLYLFQYTYIYFNIRRITWTRTMKHLLSVY